MSNVFVVGPEPFNLALLKSVPRRGDIRFLELLSNKEAVEVAEGFSFDALVERAAERLRTDGPAAAIVNYWDFPGSCLAPLLCRMHGLPAPALPAVATFEHKFWARKEMAAAVPEATPAFCSVDPFAEDPTADIDIDYPFWIKPIISHSSYLGFKVESPTQLSRALAVIRGRIRQFGDPFDEFLRHVDVPPAIAGVHGSCCIAEEIISARHQVTLEGYMWQGDAVPLGWVDSLREGPMNSCFSHYAYPSKLSAPVLERMEGYTRTLLRRVGYDNAPFNAEFFWDEESDRISLVEVNTRISKSHCPLFLFVDGVSHQKVVLDLALGREPEFPRRQGDWRFAAKFMVRLFQNGVVRRVPNAAEYRMVQSRYPEALIQVLAGPGQEFSNLGFQGSYSYELADIFLGGADDSEVRRKHQDVMEMLPFEVGLRAGSPSAPAPEECRADGSAAPENSAAERGSPGRLRPGRRRRTGPAAADMPARP